MSLNIEELINKMFKKIFDLCGSLSPLYGNEVLQEPLEEPLIDVFEREDEVRVYIEVKGVEPKDLKLELTEGSLEVRAEGFRETVELPKGLKVEGASSKINNNVLEVRIPKARGDEGFGL